MSSFAFTCLVGRPSYAARTVGDFIGRPRKAVLRLLHGPSSISTHRASQSKSPGLTARHRTQRAPDGRRDRIRDDRTEPSAMHTLTPPECRLRTAACVKPSARFCVHLSGCPAGMRTSQPASTSTAGVFGGNLHVNALPPAAGNKTQPRQSRLVPAGDELEAASRASVNGRTSLNISVLEVPSEIFASLVPLPVPKRASLGIIVIVFTTPKTPRILGLGLLASGTAWMYESPPKQAT